VAANVCYPPKCSHQQTVRKRPIAVMAPGSVLPFSEWMVEVAG
jgi:hypothetical protein